jgi:hypothetical protein
VALWYSANLVDNQSVKAPSAPFGGGFDAGKHLSENRKKSA